jgi:hypothetical protein
MWWPFSADLPTAQSSELDFRTSFVGADGLPEIDHDGAEFARILLAQAEQEQKDTDAEEAVAAAQAEAEEAAAAVDGVLQLSSARVSTEESLGGQRVEAADAPPAPAGDAARVVVASKNRCRYYNRERERCKRAATGLDGRCAIHKLSQFCKHPRCRKFNQGNGYCIKHGGGRKCKEEGCDKQVQGYGYCSGHGGKPICPIEGCENKRMEGGYVR